MFLHLSVSHSVHRGVHGGGVHSGGAVADPGFSKWGGHCFVTNGGAHILFSGKKCMKLK